MKDDLIVGQGVYAYACPPVEPSRHIIDKNTKIANSGGTWVSKFDWSDLSKNITW